MRGWSAGALWRDKMPAGVPAPSSELTPLALAQRSLEPRTRVGASGRTLQRVVTWHNNGRLEDLHQWWHRVEWGDSGRGRVAVGDLPLPAVQTLAAESGFVHAGVGDEAPLQARADVPRMLAALGARNVTEFRERFWTERLAQPLPGAEVQQALPAPAVGSITALAEPERSWRVSEYVDVEGGAAAGERLRGGVGGKKARGAGGMARHNGGPGGTAPLRYEGELRGTLFDGIGEVECVDGTRYVGEFSGGRPHGVGVASYNTGARFAGRLSRGVPGSVGVFEWAPGAAAAGARVRTPLGEVVPASYAGGVRGSFHGHGVLVDSKGREHIGWFDGLDGAKWLPSDEAGGEAVAEAVAVLPPGMALKARSEALDVAALARGQAEAARRLSAETRARAAREGRKRQAAEAKAIEARQEAMRLDWKKEGSDTQLLESGGSALLLEGDKSCGDGDKQLAMVDGSGAESASHAISAEVAAPPAPVSTPKPAIDFSDFKTALPAEMSGFQRPQRPPKKLPASAW